uniref:UBC core domain-containing protein n=1 Tax=Grammatophora oceanica TaxID=210454 RepID=A0A7S1Y302_9STRA|mmetsp:Transcript_19903/g.29459  ORF Transcript_19903/g.29459 Transcript_19903/m.29459 type:complete len:347 (+) Transcript_19903:40-1080(+)|eukprot:CAMPEP_0194031144 /NCGR_PEP_ID=MMETSP0009_2-20130614/4387_1 /TAXON_ID=210454 /ORGANISM="Grammatophora oceanica, Strain CCMP 410" /LENGTH=346 /DNA_ID=CAMNT_0038671217 /DNA_START=7 /DNA_END=1047 /DNA_ORIENTATION=-
MSKSPSLRRIQADVRELALDPSERYYAAPLENDMFEWHFTIRGAEGTDFEGGVYHGRILLPPEYPFKPPHIVFLTPSGRFETHTKVCLSFTAYHAELWQPAWGIRLILEALISFLPTPADGAIGALDWTAAERKKLAKRSVNFCCSQCCAGGKVINLLPKLSDEEKAKKSASTQFSKELDFLQKMQAINETKNKTDEKETDEKGEEKEGDAKSEEIKNAPTASVDAKGDTGGAASSGETPSETTKAASDPPQPQVAETVNEPTPAGVPAVEEEPRPPVTEAPATEAPVVQPATAAANNPWEYDISWLTDPMLNTAIVLLAIICWLFTRRAHALLEELGELKKAQVS